MIYASASTILNLSKSNAWDFLQTAVKNLDQLCDEINELEILEDYYDGYLRSVDTKNAENYLERVFNVKEGLKIILRLENHQMYIGETIFQILASNDDFLSEKKVTLTLALMWRIHPGMIEAPIINKQNYVDQIIENIQIKANNSVI